MIIKAQLGLGDAIYTYPIVKYYSDLDDVTIISKYPVIFSALNVSCSDDYTREFNINPRYTGLRSSNNNQYKDMLNSVGLNNLPFSFDWNLGFSEYFKRNHLSEFMQEFCSSKKRLCLIKEPVAAHMHKKRKDFSMSPNIEEIINFIDEYSSKYYFVSVGSDEAFKVRLSSVDYDLVDKTTVQDLITLCTMSDFIATQVGHLVPLAQILSKKLRIFYPENITDRRLKNISPVKIEI